MLCTLTKQVVMMIYQFGWCYAVSLLLSPCLWFSRIALKLAHFERDLIIPVYQQHVLIQILHQMMINVSCNVVMIHCLSSHIIYMFYYVMFYLSFVLLYKFYSCIIFYFKYTHLLLIYFCSFISYCSLCLFFVVVVSWMFGFVYYFIFYSNNWCLLNYYSYFLYFFSSLYSFILFYFSFTYLFIYFFFNYLFSYFINIKLLSFTWSCHVGLWC